MPKDVKIIIEGSVADWKKEERSPGIDGGSYTYGEVRCTLGALGELNLKGLDIPGSEVLDRVRVTVEFLGVRDGEDV